MLGICIHYSTGAVWNAPTIDYYLDVESVEAFIKE